MLCGPIDDMIAGLPVPPDHVFYEDGFPTNRLCAFTVKGFETFEWAIRAAIAVREFDCDVSIIDGHFVTIFYEDDYQVVYEHGKLEVGVY